MPKFTPAVQELENTFSERQTGPFVDRGGSVGFDVRAYGAVLDGTADDRNALADAITATQASGVKVVTLAGGTALVGGALTVPNGVTLRVPEGAKLKPANGVTLTINGAFEAGLYQVFDLSAGGSVSFGAGSVDLVRPEWFGAKADGVTDCTDALNTALAVAADVAGRGLTSGTDGGVVALSFGTYGVSSDIELPMGVKLIGCGSRSTRIRWIGAGNVTNAVLTSNLNGQYGNGFAHDIRVVGLRVECAGQGVGAQFHGWNENCTWDDFEIAAYTVTGLILDSVGQPATNITQHTRFGTLRLIPNNTGATTSLWCRNVRRCHFQQITVDQTSNASANGGVGIRLERGCEQNTFFAGHLEDCGTPIEIGENGGCYGNTFIGFDAQNPHAAPTSRNFAGRVGTMVAVIHAGNHSNNFISFRESYGYDYLYVDEERDRDIPGAGGGSGVVTFQSFIFSSKTGLWLSDGGLTSIQTPLNASSNAVDVANKNTVLVNTSSGDVTIGGLSGGVVGQVVRIIKTTSANSLIINHNDAAGTEKIITPNAANITRSAGTYGGIVLEYNGTNWFVIGT